MPDQDHPDPTWTALRTDVMRLYDTACACPDSSTQALRSLHESLPIDAGFTSKLDVVRWAVRGLGRDYQLAAALIGLDDTRGRSKKHRWAVCAELSDKHKTPNGFRKGRRGKRPLIPLTLDEITDQIASIAKQYGFNYEAQHLASQALNNESALWDSRLAPKEQAVLDAEAEYDWDVARGGTPVETKAEIRRRVELEA